jgi:hypothetical protein
MPSARTVGGPAEPDQGRESPSKRAEQRPTSCSRSSRARGNRQAHRSRQRPARPWRAERDPSGQRCRSYRLPRSRCWFPCPLGGNRHGCQATSGPPDREVQHGSHRQRILEPALRHRGPAPGRRARRVRRRDRAPPDPPVAPHADQHRQRQHRPTRLPGHHRGGPGGQHLVGRAVPRLDLAVRGGRAGVAVAGLAAAPGPPGRPQPGRAAAGRLGGCST